MRRRALICLALVSPLLLLGLAILAGFRLNHTRSFPVGIYRTVAKHPEKSDLVTFAPPQTPTFNLALYRGYIGPGDLQPYEHMIKRLVAVGGDVVSIDAGGVSVNGESLVNSAPQLVDVSGRPMPVCRLQAYRLKADEILVMSDYSRISFDGRYFGPIPRSCLRSVIRPVWTW
jgi:conjugative transfer signal peptidase TraF